MFLSVHRRRWTDELGAGQPVRLQMKTVRFSEVIKQGGVPVIHLTWTAPAHDPELRRALQAHRLVSVHQQQRGAKKDYGSVGLEIAKNTQFLIFPRSVRRFTPQRIVGVNYDLLGSALSSRVAPRASQVVAPAVQTPTKHRTISKNSKLVPFTDISENPQRKPESAAPAAPDDPILHEVWLALGELSTGATQRAQKRLQRLLKRTP